MFDLRWWLCGFALQVALALFAQQSLRGIFRRKRPLSARQHLRKGGTGRGQHARCQRDAMEPMSRVAPHRHIHDVIPRWLSTDTGSTRRGRVCVVAPATVTAPSKLPPLISASPLTRVRPVAIQLPPTSIAYRRAHVSPKNTLKPRSRAMAV